MSAQKKSKKASFIVLGPAPGYQSIRAPTYPHTHVPTQLLVHTPTYISTCAHSCIVDLHNVLKKARVNYSNITQLKQCIARLITDIKNAKNH